jgi:hypothetical protein
MTMKKTSTSIILSLLGYILSSLSCLPGLAQDTTNGSTNYQIEMAGSAASGKYTPFWIVSNQYGTVPLDAGNAALHAGIFHNQSLGNGLHWSTGLDVLAVTPRYRNIYVQQLYAAIQYKGLHLTIGCKENYHSLWSKELSSGDMVVSANARPIPEINLSVPGFTTVPFTKGILQIRGNLAVGQSFDSRYLYHFLQVSEAKKDHFVENIRWHHKSVHIRVLDPKGKSPFSFLLGVRHHAQWGGVSTDSILGKQPQSFKDFLRIFFGKSGGEDASLSDQINVLGNHYGSYDFRLGYLNPSVSIHLYKQHYYDDKSGMELYNIQDGLYGIQVELPKVSLLNKIVMEFLTTRHQSGPIHYILFDHDLYPGYGGGSDNYYNNGEYTTGVSYFNRGIGSPLLTSPEYNDSRTLGFKNNRVRAFHIGLQGYLSNQVSYRLLATSSEGWGTMSRPFLKKQSNFLFAAKIDYCHPRLENWLFSAEIASDSGSTYGDNFGVSISIKKTGVLKRW